MFLTVLVQALTKHVDKLDSDLQSLVDHVLQLSWTDQSQVTRLIGKANALVLSFMGSKFQECKISFNIGLKEKRLNEIEI